MAMNITRQINDKIIQNKIYEINLVVYDYLIDLPVNLKQGKSQTRFVEIETRRLQIYVMRLPHVHA